MCFSFVLLQSYLPVCCANEWHPKETTSDARTALLFADAMYFQPELLPTTNRLNVQIKGGRIWETFALFNSDAYKPETLVNEAPTLDGVFTNLETSFQGRQRNGKGIDYLQFASRTSKAMNLEPSRRNAGHFPLDEKAPDFDRHCNVWWTSSSPKCARRTSRYTRPGIGSVSSLWFL